MARMKNREQPSKTLCHQENWSGIGFSNATIVGWYKEILNLANTKVLGGSTS